MGATLDLNYPEPDQFLCLVVQKEQEKREDKHSKS